MSILRYEVNQKKLPLFVSFSGGLSSGMMAQMIIESNYNRIGTDIHFGFCDTMAEHTATYSFIENFKEHFGIKIHIYKKSLFELIEEQKKLPNQFMRFCSDRIKVKGAIKLIRNIGLKHCYQSIGLRYDEPKRVSRKNNSRNADDFIFPLFEKKITKKDVNEHWENMPFTLEIPNYMGNCLFCFMKSKRKLITLAKQFPEDFEKMIELEERFAKPNVKKNHKVMYSGFRYDITMRQIKELSKQPLLFDFENSNCEIDCACTD